ncbi:MAG TPA: hydrolase [Clostridiales bacterium]|nr:hydrolase [Clostridiales bacterium]
MKYVMIINEKDDVAVVGEEIAANDDLYFVKDEEKVIFKALNNIPIYHKVAIKNIEKGKDVIKYGEKIGFASQDIKMGEHVHLHNIDHY